MFAFLSCILFNNHEMPHISTVKIICLTELYCILMVKIPQQMNIFPCFSHRAIKARASRGGYHHWDSSSHCGGGRGIHSDCPWPASPQNHLCWASQWWMQAQILQKLVCDYTPIPGMYSHTVVDLLTLWFLISKLSLSVVSGTRVRRRPSPSTVRSGRMRQERNSWTRISLRWRNTVQRSGLLFTLR